MEESWHQSCLIVFWIDFLSILAPTWDPTWSHVGHLFAQNGAAQFKTTLFFVGSMLFFDFFFRPGPVLAPFGLALGGVGARFWKFLISIFLYFL